MYCSKGEKCWKNCSVGTEKCEGKKSQTRDRIQERETIQGKVR